MTRKDYVVIAAALARTRPDYEPRREPNGYWEQWRVTRDAIMGALQADNHRFDRARFIRATEVD